MNFLKISVKFFLTSLTLYLLSATVQSREYHGHVRVILTLLDSEKYNILQNFKFDSKSDLQIPF
jgi:hypothetical protein